MNNQRLIDANALKKNLSWIEECPYIEGVDKDIFEAIDNAPTVEARPKGEWVKSKDGYTRCNRCGSRGSAIKARYCHHCGADMRGKEE